MENIRMHGAKGDGKTDDTQALLSAIAAAETGRGGNVYLPEGTYRIGSGVTVPYEVELYFDVGGVLCPDRDVKLNSAPSLQTSIRRSTGLPKRSFLPAGGISSGTAATAFTICRMIFM
ncbi:MAG: hypothetical protein E7486_05515 [Ruminococcaceae bacterium]|nr:hypothetical protein [Oscillospiraceae bacterium]